MRVRPSSIPLMSSNASKDNVQNGSEVENKRDAAVHQQSDEALVAKKAKKQAKPIKKKPKAEKKPDTPPTVDDKVIEVGPKAPMVSFSMV